MSKRRSKAKTEQRPAPSGARDDALSQTLLTKPKSKDHREAVWEFGRMLKAIPAFADKPDELLRSIVKQWHDRWNDLFNKFFDDTWGRFIDAWESIRYPLTIEVAVERAKQQPDFPEILQYDDPKTRLLAKTLREIQRVNPGKPFPFGCREARDFLGIDKDAARDRFKTFTRDRLIHLEQKGFTGRNSTWVFLGPMDAASGDGAATEP